jgi:hypothetical protein
MAPSDLFPLFLDQSLHVRLFGTILPSCTKISRETEGEEQQGRHLAILPPRRRSSPAVALPCSARPPVHVEEKAWMCRGKLDAPSPSGGRQAPLLTLAAPFFRSVPRHLLHAAV